MSEHATPHRAATPPVDWDYDFGACGWDRGGSCNPKIIPERIDALRRLAADPGHYEATPDGGIPRVGWGRVLKVGMWDGWPFWRPVPSVLIDGWAGPEWSWWFGISDVREVQR